MCKDTNTITQPSAQNNANINLNINMMNLQIVMDGWYYPNQVQLSNFSQNFFEPFYRSFMLCCEALYGECAISEQTYRDVLPIFAFDLTAQKIRVKNTPNTLQIIGQRNNVTPTAPGDNWPNNVNFYIITFQEKFFKANYITQMLKQESINVCFIS